MSDLVPVVRTESLGGTPLSRAAREGRLPRWYREIPTSRDAWRAYADAVASSVPDQWLDRLRGSIAPSGRAGARLERSAGGKGLVVTTGQQPGLFGGPLMTLVKAISARALADELEAVLRLPVAPVFWAATDDADFDEAAAVSVALRGGARELRLEQQSSPGTPMARVALNGDIGVLAQWLRESCGSAAHSSYLETAVRAFGDGATMGDAYVATLRDVLEPLEISVLDASHRDVSAAADTLLDRAARRADAVAAAVRQRTDDIAAEGFTPQVEEVAGLSLVFLNADSTKRRLPIRESMALGPMGSGHFLSSTVLLRPVVERAILPSACYVAGPGEFAYFAQVTAVADALDTPAPAVVPRWSTTIVEPHVRRTLDELRLDVDDLADPHAADAALARDAVPPAVAQALAALRRDAAADVAALTAASGALIPPSVLDGLGRSIEHRVARAERRVLAGVKRREAESMTKLATVRGALFPHGVRQERRLAYIPFLARYGTPLLDAMVAAARTHARSIVESGAPSLSSAAIPVAR